MENDIEVGRDVVKKRDLKRLPEGGLRPKKKRLLTRFYPEG